MLNVKRTPEPIPGQAMVDALRVAFQQGRERENAESKPGPLGWVLSVPDTHQKTGLIALDAADDIRVITCATEDEAHAINAGLHMGGQQVALVIQHAGIFASVNTLRGVAVANSPAAMLPLTNQTTSSNPTRGPTRLAEFSGALVI